MTSDESRLSLAILISIGLHILLLALLPVLRSTFSLPLPQPAPVEVDLVSLPRPAPAARPAPPAAPAPPAVPAPEAQQPPAPDLLPKNQIVSPPDAGEEKEPENTRLLSDRNVSVKEESVKRGDGGAKEQPKPEAPPEQSSSQPEKKAEAKSAPPRPQADKRAAPAPAAPSSAPRPRQQLASRPSLDQLLPKAGDLAMAGPGADAAPSGDDAPRAGRDFLARSDARSFATEPGTRDFLPTVREGDITLLNTKASLFAPFVRRVASRVFDSVRIDFNQALRRGGLRVGREQAQIEAIMDRRGNLLNARVMEHNGNTGISADRALLRAASPDTFFDSNPPSGAEASDGNIHFVLIVDISVDTGVDPKGRSGYGAEGVVGVGLM